MAAIDAAGRRDRLVGLYRELQDCRKCPLADGRTTVVLLEGAKAPNEPVLPLLNVAG